METRYSVSRASQLCSFFRDSARGVSILGHFGCKMGQFAFKVEICLTSVEVEREALRVLLLEMNMDTRAYMNAKVSVFNEAPWSLSVRASRWDWGLNDWWILEREKEREAEGGKVRVPFFLKVGWWAACLLSYSHQTPICSHSSLSGYGS